MVLFVASSPWMGTQWGPCSHKKPQIVRAVQHWLYGGEALNVAVTFAASRVLYQQL